MKIDSVKRFTSVLITSCIMLGLTIKLLPLVFELIGLSSYYLIYLDEDTDYGRLIPFAVVFFSVFSLISILFFKNKFGKDIDFWFGNFGLLLVFTGFFLDFYISFKMLTPIAAFLYVYVISKINFTNNSSVAILALCLLFLPFSFFLLSKQVGLI